MPMRSCQRARAYAHALMLMRSCPRSYSCSCAYAHALMLMLMVTVVLMRVLMLARMIMLLMIMLMLTRGALVVTCCLLAVCVQEKLVCSRVRRTRAVGRPTPGGTGCDFALPGPEIRSAGCVGQPTSLAEHCKTEQPHLEAWPCFAAGRSGTRFGLYETRGKCPGLGCTQTSGRRTCCVGSRRTCLISLEVCRTGIALRPRIRAASPYGAYV